MRRSGHWPDLQPYTACQSKGLTQALLPEPRLQARLLRRHPYPFANVRLKWT